MRMVPPGVSADSDLTAAYLSWMSDVRGRQPSTVESYRSTLHTWLCFLYDRGLTFAVATLEDLEAFQVRPRHKRGRGGSGAVNTQRREIVAVRGIYRWAHSRGHIEHDPMVEAQAPSARGRQPKPVPDDQWLSAWAEDMPNGLRTATGLGYFCGLRRAEIVALRVDQLTDSRIVGFVRKGGGEDTLPWRTMVEVYEQRLPHLGHERFLEALAQSRRIGSTITPYDDPDWMNRAMRRMGFTFTPHQLRHSCATNFIRADVPLPYVTAMLNHSSPAVTMQYIKTGGNELRTWLKAQT